MSNVEETIAVESVLALLDDLRYVVDKTGPDDWQQLAGDVLEHHTPPIDDDLLPHESRQLQKWCRATLQSMVDGDEAGIRAAALKVKQYS